MKKYFNLNCIFKIFTNNFEKFYFIMNFNKKSLFNTLKILKTIYLSLNKYLK